MVMKQANVLTFTNSKVNYMNYTCKYKTNNVGIL